MVQILRTGGPDFQEVLRVILTADIISGAHFSSSGAHLWLLDISGAHLPKNYFGHDSQDLRIWSYSFQSGAMKYYDSIWENIENKHSYYIWYEVYIEIWSKISILLQWSCPLCVFKCVLKLPAQEEAKSHKLHLFGFSPLCVFKCLLKWSVGEEAKSH